MSEDNTGKVLCQVDQQTIPSHKLCIHTCVHLGCERESCYSIPQSRAERERRNIPPQRSALTPTYRARAGMRFMLSFLKPWMGHTCRYIAT